MRINDYTHINVVIRFCNCHQTKRLPFRFPHMYTIPKRQINEKANEDINNIIFTRADASSEALASTQR